MRDELPVIDMSADCEGSRPSPKRRAVRRSTPRAATPGSSTWSVTACRRSCRRASTTRARVLRVARRREGGHRDARTAVARGAVGSRSAVSSPPGVPDQKEGLYFGEELGPDDPRVRAACRCTARISFPRAPRDARRGARVHGRGHRCGARLLRGISLALGLDEHWFDRHLTAAPTVLFRIFRYPPLADGSRRQGGSGASASTPTTACSRSWRKTTWAVSKCTVATVGSRRRRSPTRSS